MNDWPQAITYKSPTYMAPFESGRKKPNTQSAECPAAIWMYNGSYKAFCNVMQLMIWQDANSEPVISCDGQINALRAYRRALAEQP